MDNTSEDPQVPRTPPRRSRRPPRRRIRRPPDDARAHILDAAERVFARFMPDEIGLRQVAAEAKVSHALVTHYFGTYETLCESVLDRRLTAVRTSVLGHLSSPVGPSTAHQILGPLPAIVALARDRLTVRLIVWALTSGRARRPDFVASRVQGLRLVVEGIERALAIRDMRVPPRERIEVAVAAGLGMTLGHALFGDVLYAALGHARAPDPGAFAAEIAAMISAYLTAAA